MQFGEDPKFTFCGTDHQNAPEPVIATIHSESWNAQNYGYASFVILAKLSKKELRKTSQETSRCSSVRTARNGLLLILALRKNSMMRIP